MIQIAGRTPIKQRKIFEYARFGIRNIPTLLIFKSGEVKERIVGITSKANLLTLTAKVEICP